MEKFLSESKAKLVNIKSFESVCVIIGNEACDLDSAVCALVFAYYLEHKKKIGSIHIPVLNIVKKDFALKTEIVYFLKRFNISLDHLVFRDDICLNALQDEGKLKLVLVDHNVLPTADSHLDSSIVQIVDHHKQEHLLSEQIDMLIEPVGSCCTLVGSFILENASEILDVVCASLLCGAIVVDVANFSVAAKRATAKDEQVFGELAKTIPHISKDVLYEELQNAKEDVSSLQVEQLFRKDAKAIEIGGIKLAVCSFPLLCSTLLIKYSDIIEKLQSFCSAYNYQGSVLMGISIDRETDTVKRDLVVFSKLPWLKNRLCRELEKSESSLNLVTVTCHSDYVFYDQGNITATRKIVLPMLKSILSKPETSNMLFHHGEKSSITSATNTDASPEDSSSASSSGIDTPTNSCVDDEEIRRSSVAKLSDFHSAGDVLASIESKKFLACRRRSDGLHTGDGDPLTPENSFAESHFDQSYKKFVLNQMDSDAIERKLRQENFFSEADE